MLAQQMIEFDFPEDENQIHTLDINIKKAGPLHMALNSMINFSSSNQQPIVRPYNAQVPSDIEALYRIVNNPEAYHSVCPHFFTSDEHIEPAWTKPFYYATRLSKFGCCISPDLSIYADMVDEQKRWNSFRNKYLTAFWQAAGIDVIPAPSWGDMHNFDYYMEGWPKQSVIAINSTGIGRDQRSQFLFREGYEAMFSTLQPTHIIRYGGVMEGERTDISTYFTSDHRKEVHHGS